MDPFTFGAGFGFGALLVGVIFAVLCQSVARGKGRSPGWWALWGFLTTLIALIILVLLPQGQLRDAERRDTELSDADLSDAER